MMNPTIADSGAQTTIASWLLVIVQALDSLEIDSQALLDRANISLTQIKANPEKRITIDKMTAVWHEIEQLTKRPDIGFIVAQHCQIQHFRALGFSLLASETISDCLHRIENYSASISNSVNVTLQRGAHGVAICFTPKETVVISPLAIDAFLLTLHTLFIQLLQTNFPTQIEFWGKKRAHNALHYFPHCQLSYNINQARYWLPERILNIPLTLSDKNIAQLSDEKLKDYIASETLNTSSNRWLNQVTLLIEKQIKVGRISAPIVAQQLNVSERSLRRKLAEHGVTYLQLLEKSKQEFAKSELIAGRNVTELGYLLGYQDSSNFSRAFKRWFGISPRQFAKRNKTQ